MALFLCFGSVAPAVASEPTRYRLLDSAGKPIVPLTSSAVSTKQGPLLSVLGVSPSTRDKAWFKALPKNAQQAGIKKSIFDRYLLLLGQVFGEKSIEAQVFEMTRADFVPVPDALDWYGHCDQWSAYAFDPDLTASPVLRDGLFCPGTVLEASELRELLSGLFKVYFNLKMFGARAPAPEGSNQEKGAAALLPHLLVATAIEQFKAGGVFSIDRAVDERVFNEPVFDLLLSPETELDGADPTISEFAHDVKIEAGMKVYRLKARVLSLREEKVFLGTDAAVTESLWEYLEFRDSDSRVLTSRWISEDVEGGRPDFAWALPDLISKVEDEYRLNVQSTAVLRTFLKLLARFEVGELRGCKTIPLQTGSQGLSPVGGASAGAAAGG